MYDTSNMSTAKGAMPESQATRAQPQTAGITWSRDVPDEIRALCSLTDADYADVFAGPLPAGRDESAPEWAHIALDLTPGRARGPVVAIQRYALGLRLQSKGKAHYLGWKAVAEDEDWIRLQAASAVFSVEMVFRRDANALAVGCFVRYDRRMGGLIWPPLSLIHRQAGRLMMRRALRPRHPA
jgi:hypothetical protein